MSAPGSVVKIFIFNVWYSAKTKFIKSGERHVAITEPTRRRGNRVNKIEMHQMSADYINIICLMLSFLSYVMKMAEYNTFCLIF